jgi:hypothetical protein
MLKQISAVAVAFAFLLPASAAAQAHLPLETASRWERWTPPVGVLSVEPGTLQAGESGDVVLTTVGATAGFGLGVVASLVVFSMNPTSGNSPAEMLALAGVAAGPAIGAHLANRKRGDVWVTLLATGAVVAASAVVLTAADEPSLAYFVAIPIFTVGTATATELLTSSR